MKHLVAIAALAALAACATGTVTSPSAPTGSTTIPSSPLDLGDWRNTTAPQTLSAFEANVSGRYGVGIAVSDATADLRRQDFNCAPAPRSADGRGAPPAQVCRRTVTANSCTHTWQVHVFDEAGNGRIARTRGLYDRRCGNEGLLGGPG